MDAAAGQRTTYALLVYLSVFFVAAIASYYVLPEGFLKNKNPLQNWSESGNVIVLAMQIFFYNLISVVMIVGASFFGKKKAGEDGYFSLGYHVLLILMVTNGIVLGTWSFAVSHEAPPLVSRVFGTLDIFRRGALWEMSGQIIIAAALACISVIKIGDNTAAVRKLRDMKLSRSMVLLLFCGLILMAIGAAIESVAIGSL